MKSLHQNALIWAAASILLVGCGSDDDDYVNIPDPEPEPENTAPQAQTASFTTEADTAVMDSLMGTDPDDDELTYEVAMAPANGELNVNSDGSFTYTPAPTYTGSDSFSFTVSDGMETSEAAQVQITVNALEVSFSTYSRAVFNAAPNDEPMPVEGREFEQDVTQPDAYDDLLMSR